MIFYDILLYFVALWLTGGEFTLDKLNYSIIIFFDSKWFIGEYIILYCLSPFLNIITERLDRKKFEMLLLILFCFSSVLPTLSYRCSFNDSGVGILTFLFLYFIGGYIKLYYKLNINKYFYLLIFIVCSAIIGFLSISPYNHTCWLSNNIFNIISTVCFLLFF